MNPQVKAAAKTAWIHSSLVTAAGIVAGFLGGAAATGAAASPQAFLAYTKTTWFSFAITQVICPAIRAFVAAKGAS